MRHQLTILAALLCTAAPAIAQGSDNCASATAISGVGTFAVSTTGATTSPQQSGGCATANADVWFKWTSSFTGSAVVSLCGGTPSADTVLAAYAGSSCPTSGTELACNDDTCNFESQIAFSVTSGSTYMLQVGDYYAGTTYTGTFTIAAAVPCGTSTGPDVIVGDLTGPSNFTPTGGLDAISIGTTSCNLGSVWLNWMANNNQHPAIGGNLYRYRVQSGSGRFEQIGMSWLKHGFYALSENLCCAVCNSTDGTHLGVGCSDPYTSDRNGGQASLGPRWQVNASSGVFTYPPANPSWSGSTARRCEFLSSDVDMTAGVRYFGEAQYITPDDAAAGNNNNNASYRELTVTNSAGDFTFNYTGVTQRAKAAIEAWPTCESGVTLVNVQADGKFTVGYKVTNLGGGQYHYEYAVYNENSDKSCGSFSIPIGSGLTITNVGFHDVTYRNGDGNSSVNFSGTDWPVTQTTSITWATETVGTNANANAVRWGTTYNFRFDANSAPAAGTATLGLWKSGTTTTVNVDVPGGGATSFAFCSGDGTGTACPCANAGVAGNGCANSVNANGANLAATGTASISSDTFTLHGTGMPNSSALYFQGQTQIAGGAGAVFGDGLRCAGGTTIRLGTKNNAGGASQYPVGADLSVSVKGADAVGNVRTYQCWYRNAAAFCTAFTYNLTNGYQTTWAL